MKIRKRFEPYEAFQKYAVQAKDLQDFIDRYHKAGIITDFNREDDYESHKRDIEREGFTFIPKADSITGEIVSYYGRI
jgi:hypothetical protein